MHLMIDGVVHTRSPLHIAEPGGGDRVHGTTRTRTWRMPIVNPDGVGATPYPIIPANTLRGSLRRRAADQIQAVLMGQGRKLGPYAYNAIRCGLPHGKPDGRLPSVPEYQEAAEHPFFGLFGGGPRLLPSRIVTDTLYPIIPQTLAETGAGVVPGRYQDAAYRPRPQTGDGDDGAEAPMSQRHPQLTQTLFFRRVDDVLQFMDPNANDSIEDYTNTALKWQETVGQGEEDGEGEGGNENWSLRGWNALEIVIPGVPYYMQVKTGGQEITEAQAGLILRALEALPHHPWGGWTRNGFGQADYDLYLHTEEGTAVPLFARTEGTIELNTDDATIQALVAAGDEAIEGIDKETIERLMEPAKKPASMEE